MSTRSLLARLGLAIILCGAVHRAAGQAAAPEDTAAAGPVTELDKYTVSGVPLVDQILPTVRPIGSVMGDEEDILDVPRSVTSVNQAWMDDRQVTNAMDFGQFAPGVYSEAQYGIPSVPFIRGDLAQMYVNGQAMMFMRDSVPPSFNGIDAMDIVKGPGSAVYGPQDQGAGGYVNLVTKQPYFDGFHAELSATLGYWTSGHSYAEPEFTIDLGGPLSRKLAYRVSYLSRYGDSYYINDHNQTQDVFAALTYLASDKFRLDFWAQFYEDRTEESQGANRVTQQFIWNGTYVTGPAVAAYGNDTIPVGATTPTVFSGAYSIVQPTGTVKLPDYDALVAPGDVARSGLFQSQLVATDELFDDAKIINRTYVSVGHSNKVDLLGYDEYIPVEESIQDRLEFHDSLNLLGMANTFIGGGDFRYTRLLSYDDFTVEPYAYFDLSASQDNVYPAYAADNYTFGSGYRVPGTTTYSGGPYADDQDTFIYDSAVFAQDTVKLTSKLSAVAGYRLDGIEASDASPPFDQVGAENSDFIFVAFNSPVYVPEGALRDVSGSVADPSYFASLFYKPVPTSTLYLTYNRIDALLGSDNFGGVSVPAETTLATQQAGLQSSLTTPCTLYEAGYKQSLFGNTLYFAVDAFQQLRLGSQLGGPNYLLKDNGLEFETVYQPTLALAVNANLTYQNDTAFAPAGGGFYEQTGSYLDDYPTTYLVDGKYGTGNGSPNFEVYVPPSGRMRAPGIPQFMANLFVEYKFPHGFGIGLGPQILGRQYADDEEALHIPSEYELDGYLFYRQKRWDVRVNVRNITNQRLLDPIDVTFAGNDEIFVREPISASVTIRWHL
ncbi:MAG TPA: TonB-dependent receptor plug domain-containing protein [Opitutaceae bacterium]|jgi:outer membrane receptor for monomeric catechols|nr:TonB-dependent receptor plug domain-containing protein [Opitutaceae bacterium]